MRIIVLLLCISTITCKVYAVEKLPVEAFGRLPDVSQIVLSDDGYRLANLVRIDVDGYEGSLISLYDTRSQTHKALLRTSNEKFIINSIRWANDETLLIGARFPGNRYGTPTTETRLMKINVETAEASPVISDRTTKKFKWVPQFQDNIIDLLPDEPNFFLMTLDTEGTGDAKVYRVNLNNGHIKRYHRHRRHVRNWITDQDHNIRVGIYQDGTDLRVLTRNSESNSWFERWRFESFDEAAIAPLGFGKDPNILFVRAYHDDRKAIFKVDLSKKNSELELVFSDPNFDVNGNLIFSKSTRDVVGISYAENGGFTFWDPELDKIQDSVNAVLPDTKNFIYGMAIDQRRYLVLSLSDTNPGTYYLGDRDKGTLEAVGRRYEALNPELMSEKQVVEYEARDGLKIQAYLSLPKGIEHKNLPAIVFPHGGPISFDDGGFDYWTQFFVNRGYAVLQMNFRGSSGYGFDFMKAGLQNWGKEMQDDVEDGAHWLAERGVVDPQRICIVGASYGGYAALMATVKSPDLFRCAISFAGIGDVEALVKSHRRYSNFEVVQEQIGDDYKELRNRSPVNFVEKITTPVLLVHGTDDRSVKVEQSRDMEKAMRKAGKHVEYIELDGGDHHLSNNDHRLTTFSAMDEFLAKHLPVEK